jgi:hypothetical protein
MFLSLVFAVKWIGVALHEITTIFPPNAIIIIIAFQGTEIVAFDLCNMKYSFAAFQKKFNCDYPFDDWCMYTCG